MNQKDFRKDEIMREIDDLNHSMQAKPYSDYSKEDQIKYVDRQIILFKELRELSSLFDRIKVDAMIRVLEMSRRRI